MNSEQHRKQVTARNSAFFVFRWHVLPDGYRWLTTDFEEPLEDFGESPEEQSRFLIARDPQKQSPFRIYQPLDRQNLFREFGRLDPTDQDQIVAFANECGWLEKPECKYIALDPTKKEKRIPIFGERYLKWKTAIEDLKEAVALWETLLTANADHKRMKLNEVIQWDKWNEEPWQGQDMVNYRKKRGAGFSYRRIAGPHPLLYPGKLKRLRPGKVATPAWEHLRTIVTEKLEGRVSPCLLWKEVESEDQPPPLGVYCMPKSLLSALWLQFTFAIAGDTEYRKCRFCDKPFAVSREAKNSKQRYCSDSCKTLQSRQNRSGKKIPIATER